jgi:hypothetical protein
MIKELYNRWKDNKSAKADAIILAKERRDKAMIAEYKALYTISIQNTTYLRSSINVHRSSLVNIKERNGAETKKKKEFMKRQIEWLERKLEEETAMVSHYSSLAKI